MELWREEWTEVEALRWAEWWRGEWADEVN